MARCFACCLARASMTTARRCCGSFAERSKERRAESKTPSALCPLPCLRDSEACEVAKAAARRRAGASAPCCCRAMRVSALVQPALVAAHSVAQRDSVRSGAGRGSEPRGAVPLDARCAWPSSSRCALSIALRSSSSTLFCSTACVTSLRSLPSSGVSWPCALLQMNGRVFYLISSSSAC